MAWQGAVGANFLPFKTVTLSPSSGGTTGSFDKNFIPELFKMHACVYANSSKIVGSTGAQPLLLGSTAGAYGSKDVMTSGADGLQTGTGSSQIGYKQFGSNGGSNSECGQIEYADVSKGASSQYAGAGSSFWGGSNTGADALGVDTQAQRRAIEAAAQSQFVALDAKVDELAKKFVFGPNGNDGVAGLINNPDAVKKLTPYDPFAVHQMTTIYQSATSDAIAHAMHDSNALTDAAKAMAQHAQEDGFTTAGAWYMTMAQTSYAMNSFTNNVSPTISKSVVPPQYADGNTIWFKTYDMINAAGQVASGNDSMSNGSGGDQAGAWRMVMKAIGTDIPCVTNGHACVNWLITDSSGQPVMLRLKTMADRLVTLSMLVLVAVGAAIGAFNDNISNAITGVAVDLFTFGQGSRGTAALIGGATVILDMVKFIMQLSTGFFLMCSIYLPMVPFVIFMGQVLNWLITVVEGVSAAPFLAFAHLDTDGEGLGQKTHYGYTFMLQSFMRPVILVLGFMFACILLETIGGYVMQIYPTVMANAQMDSVTGLFSIMGFSALFFVIMSGLVNTCMTVMYLLPDAIFSFIGAHNSATAGVGRDEAKKMEGGSLAGAAISRQGSSHVDHQGAGSRSRQKEAGGGGGKGDKGGKVAPSGR